MQGSAVFPTLGVDVHVVLQQQSDNPLGAANAGASSPVSLLSSSSWYLGFLLGMAGLGSLAANLLAILATTI